MGQRQVEVCDVEVSGPVQSVSRGKKDDGSYVRFHGAQGEVSVFVPDSVLVQQERIAVGDRVVLAIDVAVRGQWTLLTAYSVHNGSKPVPRKEPVA